MHSFRPFKISDCASIASWVGDEREYYMWCAGKLGKFPMEPQQLESVYNEIVNDSHKIWMVACEDDKPFGFLAYSYDSPDFDSVCLCYVIVDSQLRGKGYGKVLLKLAQDYAFNLLNVYKISLSVFEENERAYNTYISAGFSNAAQVDVIQFPCGDFIRHEMALYSASNDKHNGDDGIPEDKMIAEVLKNNSFAYAFQPIVYASTGEIYGYEALMRAQHEGITISPAAVLDYATKYDKLYDIERATLHNVMERYESSKNAFGSRKVFINSIPGYQLTDVDYKSFRETHKDNFSNVLIEITEMNDLSDKELQILLQRSSQDGIGLAIDDYGTGYSNTASLLKYLPDCVKLDRLLISNINEDTKKQHFVKGMVEFAHANGFRLLAEGVETSAELRTVIDMGVDLIQGFYTARPSFEIIDEIPAQIRDEMVSMNHKSQTADTRKIYVAKEDRELPLMRLSLEQYTGILVDSEELLLVGNRNYCAEMSIKIKDGCKCHLTLLDVYIESFMQLPCIELGNKSELTLELKGENRLRKVGIFVPKDSRFNVVGDGNLALRVQGIKGYGIGSDYDSNFGSITWNGTGALDILVEADEGIGIGGGKSQGDAEINIKAGTVRIEPACGHSVAIGCVRDVVPINVDRANVHLDLKTDQGIGIGCGGEGQNTVITNSNLNIICAGTCIAAIGSNYDTSTGGCINIDDSDLSILGNGQKLYFIGARNGSVNIGIRSSSVNLRGEGNEITAIGSKDDAAFINLDHTNIGIKISSGNPKTFGAAPGHYICRGGIQSTSINE